MLCVRKVCIQSQVEFIKQSFKVWDPGLKKHRRVAGFPVEPHEGVGHVFFQHVHINLLLRSEIEKNETEVGVTTVKRETTFLLET